MNIGYTPSQLTENDVILEKLNDIIEYLSDHPSYQVYAYNGGFITGTLTYEIANVLNSTNINVADVVVFNNGYYGIISEITETEFTLTAGISLIGPQGAKGDKGDKGDYGPGIYFYFKPISQDVYQIDMGYVAKPDGRELQNGDILFSLYDATEGNIGWVLERSGELIVAYLGSLQGPQGLEGESGLSTYFINTRIDSETTSVSLIDITNVTNRTIQAGDILISSHPDSFGECVVVVQRGSSTANVNYIGSLHGSTVDAGTFVAPQGPQGPQGPSGALSDWQIANANTELEDGTYLVAITNFQGAGIVSILDGQAQALVSYYAAPEDNNVTEIQIEFYDKKYSQIVMVSISSGSVQTQAITAFQEYQYIRLK